MNKRMIFTISYLVLGIACLVLSIFDIVPNDEFISGFGGAFVAIGVLRISQLIKYKKNEDYRHKIDVYEHDERLAYCSALAWQKAGKISIAILGICCIVCCFIANDLVPIFSSIVCGITLIYYFSYIYVSHRN